MQVAVGDGAARPHVAGRLHQGAEEVSAPRTRHRVARAARAHAHRAEEAKVPSLAVTSNTVVLVVDQLDERMDEARITDGV